MHFSGLLLICGIAPPARSSDESYLEMKVHWNYLVFLVIQWYLLVFVDVSLYSIVFIVFVGIDFDGDNNEQ